MQDTNTNESKLITPRRYTTKEERRRHLENWKKSGLTMSKYSRQNNIALASLSEWKRALITKSPKFKSVQLISPSSLAEELISQNDIIEIIIDQRIKVRLQQSSPSLLIYIIKGLMTCN